MLVVHIDLGVSKNRGTPKSSILIGFSIINHPFWGVSTLFLVQHPFIQREFWIRLHVLGLVRNLPRLLRL